MLGRYEQAVRAYAEEARAWSYLGEAARSRSGVRGLGQPLPGWALTAARKAYALQVALQPLQGLQVVSDAPYLQGLVSNLAGLGVPVFLRFGAEMNGDWTAWSGDLAVFVEKFRLVARAARKANNVAVVWCPNSAPEDNIAQYYPGDDYVDWVGLNFYSDYYMNGRPSEPLPSQYVHHQGRLASPLEKLDYVYAKYANRKPVMICEIGAAHRSVTTGEDVTSWGMSQLGMLYGNLPLRFPRVKAVFYYSVDQGSPCYPADNRWSNYCLTDNQPFLGRYRELVSLPWYLERPGDSSPVAITRRGSCPTSP
ncbi:MAG: glycosyl hydrolase [Bacillota bacterium]|nr:glycosyl hydrolase [Bacillota bacterium]